MTTDLTRYEPSSALALPDPVQFKRDIAAINQFQQIVHANLIADQDYGVIPGTTKPSLLKPGAEKIAKLLGLADTYDIIDRLENWDKPFFRYLVKCKLTAVANGILISEGLGECNSMEARYRWREAKRKCPVCGKETIIKGKAEYGGGWICFAKTGGCGAKWSDDTEEAEAIANQAVGKVENEDIYSQVNTILKMAKKRALVDASLSAGRLSNIFTQDMEDLPESTPKEGSIVRSKVILPSNMELNDWNAFWGEVKRLGLTDSDVRAILGTKGVKDWQKLDKGNTLARALALCRTHVAQKGKAPPTTTETARNKADLYDSAPKPTSVQAEQAVKVARPEAPPAGADLTSPSVPPSPTPAPVHSSPAPGALPPWPDAMPDWDGWADFQKFYKSYRIDGSLIMQTAGAMFPGRTFEKTSDFSCFAEGWQVLQEIAILRGLNIGPQVDPEQDL